MTEIDNRNHTIDVLKGIAIILVLITHYEWTNDQRKFFVFPYVINMAIPLFMILTGYVNSVSMKRSGIVLIEEAYQWPRLLKRFTRYTIPLIVMIVWELFDPNITVSKNLLDVLRWIITGTIGKGSYYYPIMVQLIFIFPVIYFIQEHHGKNGLWICLIVNTLYELIAWAYYVNTETYRLLIFRYIFLIAAGAYAFKGYKLKLYTAMVMTFIGAGFISMVIYFGYETRIVNGPWASSNFISSMWVIPLLIWVLQKVRISVTLFEIIGRASYHIFMVQMIYYLGYYETIKDKVNSWVGHLIVGIIICLIIGVVFYYMEKPLQTWIQNRIQSIFEKRA